MKTFEPIIQTSWGNYRRIPVKTAILTPANNMALVVKKAIQGLAQPGDVISISESPLAITQGRAVPESELHIGLLAKLLWRFVYNNPCGVGLRAPSSMQCAIDEAGAPRILVAAAAGALAKLLKKRGWFYRVAGMQAALVDGAHTSPVPPYDKTVIKGPLHPAKEAAIIANTCGYPVAVMDINDIGGCWCIGASPGLNKGFMEQVMKDNPQGQGDELTPICLIRKA